MKKPKLINFANIFYNLPEKYLKAMTDEEFHMAMFYNIWPEVSLETMEKLDINPYLPFKEEEHEKNINKN